MTGPHITELFGLAPLDDDVARLLNEKACPFTGQTCSKKHAGVCAVSNGASTDSVIVCPNRLYGDNYWVLRDVAEKFYGNVRFIVGDREKTRTELHSERAAAVIARREVHLKDDGGQASFDWLLHYYDDSLVLQSVIAIEAQSMDTTGSYRAEHADWIEWHSGKSMLPPGRSNHGINWANVRKRLADQLLRKGAVLSNTTRCEAFCFVLPDIVFKSFEKSMPTLIETAERGSHVLTICTVDPDNTTPAKLSSARFLSFLRKDIISALYSSDTTLDESIDAFDADIQVAPLEFVSDIISFD